MTTPISILLLAELYCQRLYYIILTSLGLVHNYSRLIDLIIRNPEFRVELSLVAAGFVDSRVNN